MKILGGMRNRWLNSSSKQTVTIGHLDSSSRDSFRHKILSLGYSSRLQEINGDWIDILPLWEKVYSFVILIPLLGSRM